MSKQTQECPICYTDKYLFPCCMQCKNYVCSSCSVLLNKCPFCRYENIDINSIIKKDDIDSLLKIMDKHDLTTYRNDYNDTILILSLYYKRYVMTEIILEKYGHNLVFLQAINTYGCDALYYAKQLLCYYRDNKEIVEIYTLLMKYMFIDITYIKNQIRKEILDSEINKIKENMKKEMNELLITKYKFIDSLYSMTIPQLREYCKQHNIVYTSSSSKMNLIHRISSIVKN